MPAILVNTTHTTPREEIARADEKMIVLECVDAIQNVDALLARVCRPTLVLDDDFYRS